MATTPPSKDSDMDTSLLQPFDRERHVTYFRQCLRRLPRQYCSLDTNRLTLVHFCVQGLALLDSLDVIDTESIKEWIYSLQVKKGFMGSSTCRQDEYSYQHVAMTYTALCTLVTLGDDLARVDRQGVIQGLDSLQRDDGSFRCIPVGSECDMRFLYCACAISDLLQDWSGVNKEKAAQFISSCRSFDGGISLIPHQEGHGGSTFCGVASLVLMQEQKILAKLKPDLIKWCVHRQVGGMQGRPNKLEDTCYSYWIGGTLRMLQCDDLLQQEKLRAYVLSCQHEVFGGFSKVLGAMPDVLHSFYSLAYLSLSGTHFPNNTDLVLNELDCVLGIPGQQETV